MNDRKKALYGFICKEGEWEWWVRRKEKGKSEIIITKERWDRVINTDLSYAVSHHCRCPMKVKEVAKKLLKSLEINKL